MARRKYLDEEGLAYFWGKIKDWVNGLLIGKQDTLESGVNIKTVGGESILGEGDIPIESGASDYEDLENKPSIGGVELVGDKSAGDLGLQSAIDSSNKLSYNLLKDTPSIPTESTVAAWGFVKNTVNNLVNYYLKSETYTKAEVAALIGAIQQFHYEIYPTLPQTGQSNVLYLIGPTGSGSDRYEEYVYSSNDFTKIGDTSIDLSGYVTTSALNTALADYTTTANLTTLLAGKQDTISDLATIRSGAALGAMAYQKPSTGIPASDLASGVIPQPEVFWATYGTTTYSELTTALAANKVVLCVNSGNIYMLNYKTANDYRFYSSFAAYIYELRCTTANVWSNATTPLLRSADKVASWSSTTSDAKVPSEKLVKDSIDAVNKVFVATYGTTTYQEISDAIAAGKFVFVIDSNNNYYNYARKLNNRYYFFNSIGSQITSSVVEQNNNWLVAVNNIELSTDKVSTIAGNETNTTKYPNTKAVADALGKWGVVSQTQTWTNNPRAYTMSNLVYGIIPQANIDLFEKVGAVFNETSGYFELNGLTDISYHEMIDIYNHPIFIHRAPSSSSNNGFGNDFKYMYLDIRTNILSNPRKDSTYENIVGCGSTQSMFHTSSIEVLNIDLGLNFVVRFYSSQQFYSCSNLKKIIGVTKHEGNMIAVYTDCYNLEDIQDTDLIFSTDIKQSPNLSLASVVYMVENAANTSAITITLHANAYARCQADTTEYTYSGNTYTGILALATAKNITIASA